MTQGRNKWRTSNPTENAWWICLGINNGEAWLNLNPYLVTRDEIIITQKDTQLDIDKSAGTTEYFTFTINKPYYYKLEDETRS